ncbi:MAG: Gfo/Idh/MocA family oxidoreductase [Gemmatimonadales bacterium]
MASGPALRVGIVGAGLMGRFHARAARMAGSRVVAIADADPAAAQRLALSVGKEVASGTVDELITPERVDAVHVCTPVREHGSACSFILGRGIHVLSEKPLTQTAAETQALLDLAESHKLILCPVHQFPFQKGAIDAVARLPEVGRIRWVTAEMCTAGASQVAEALHDEVLLDILPHPLSLLYNFLGGDLATGQWGMTSAADGELLVTAVIRGTGASILLSTHGRPTGNTMRVVGDRASIALDLFHGFSTLESGRVSRLSKMARPFTSSTRTLVAATANSVRRGSARETAFPGLRELSARFYLAIVGRGKTPVSPAEMIDIATVRDRIADAVRITPAG